MSKPLLIKILVAVAVLLGLIIFNWSMRPLSSTNQKNFEEWFTVADARLRAGGAIEPEISISLGSPEAAERAGLAWSISSATPEKRQELLRLLELANAANVFNLPPPGGSGARGFVLKVTNGDRRFEALVTPERAASQMNLQVLLKLFAEYAGHATAT